MDKIVKNNYARTRFIQNKTKYFQPLNTLMGLVNKPKFIAVRYCEIAHLGEYKAIKASARRKRIAKRGKFPDINPPHEYSSTLGDPIFYTLESLPRILKDASDKRFTHMSYWIQVCDKLRKVKDILNIHHLLTCIKCIIDVNHYDPHLFKELTREFSDDFHLLSLSEIGILLRCYVVSNCKPIELLDKSLDTLASTIHNELNDQSNKAIESSSKSYVEGLLDNLSAKFTINHDKDLDMSAGVCDSQDSMTQALAHISMSLSYYSYITPNTNTLLSLYIIKFWKNFTVPYFLSILRSLKISDEYFYNNSDVYRALLSSINSFCQYKLPILYSDDDNLIWGFKDIYKRVSNCNYASTNDITKLHDYKILSIVDTLIHLCDMISIISDLRTKIKFDVWFEGYIFSNIDTLLVSLISEYNYSKSVLKGNLFLQLASKNDVKEADNINCNNILKEYSMRRSFLNYAFAYAITKCSSAINSHLMAKINKHSISPFEIKQRSVDKYHLEFTTSEKIKFPSPPNWIYCYENIELDNTQLKIMNQCNEQIVHIVYESDPIDIVKMFENIVFLMKKVIYHLIKVENVKSNDDALYEYLDSLSLEIIRKFQSIGSNYLRRLKNAVDVANYNVRDPISLRMNIHINSAAR